MSGEATKTSQTNVLLRLPTKFTERATMNMLEYKRNSNVPLYIYMPYRYVYIYICHMYIYMPYIYIYPCVHLHTYIHKSNAPHLFNLTDVPASPSMPPGIQSASTTILSIKSSSTSGWKRWETAGSRKPTAIGNLHKKDTLFKDSFQWNKNEIYSLWKRLQDFL